MRNRQIYPTNETFQIEKKLLFQSRNLVLTLTDLLYLTLDDKVEKVLKRAERRTSRRYSKLYQTEMNLIYGD